jgi:hypothetical protein
MRGLSLSLLFIAALVLNPFFACGTSFSFSLADVERALAGTWHAKVTKNGETTSVSFRIEAGVDANKQSRARHLVRPAAACGKRTLVKSAAACKDVTNVPLVLIALDDGRKMKGELSITGTRFERALARFDLGNASLDAQISSSGDATAFSTSPDETAELTHTR